MKVAIVGSRDFPAPTLVARLVEQLPSGSVVVSGGAPGVDALAEELARRRRLGVDIVRAEWTRLGRAAGPIRNREIVRRSDWVVAFWTGASRGTRSTVEAAMEAGKPVVIVWPRLAPGEKLPPRQLDLLDAIENKERRAAATLNREEVSE